MLSAAQPCQGLGGACIPLTLYIQVGCWRPEEVDSLSAVGEGHTQVQSGTENKVLNRSHWYTGIQIFPEPLPAVVDEGRGTYSKDGLL